MRSRIVDYSPEARDDLLSLFDWIAVAASPQSALSYLERLEAFCERLERASERGHRRDDIYPGLRIIGFERRVTIAFTVEPDRVTIQRVFYGGRDWEGAFE
ncbi:MAG: type II toxin-antitoxin system RelE/ParE family toxin [Pseudomonadota bacterium]